LKNKIILIAVLVVVVSLGFLYMNQNYLTSKDTECKSNSSCTQKSSTDKNDIKAGGETDKTGDIKSGEENKSDCTGKGCDGKGCTKDGMKSGEKSGGKENGCDGSKCPYLKEKTQKEKTKDSKNL